MKTAIQIICYSVAIIMGMGSLVMIGEGSMDVMTFITFILLEVQSILTLIYIHDKK